MYVDILSRVVLYIYKLKLMFCESQAIKQRVKNKNTVYCAGYLKLEFKDEKTFELITDA